MTNTVTTTTNTITIIITTITTTTTILLLLLLLLNSLDMQYLAHSGSSSMTETKFINHFHMSELTRTDNLISF